jgi:YD repeat-containing protein
MILKTPRTSASRAYSDANGNQITLAYNGHELATVTDQSGRSVGLSWSGGHLTTLTDANASSVRTVQLTYGGDLLTAVTDPLGQITTYGYDANCGLTQIVDERGDELKIRCNAEGRVAEIATCLSTVSFLYNRTVGKTYVTEKNSGGDRITTYEYDEEGKLLRKTGNCCGYNVQYGYDESNNINQLTDANGHAMAASHDGMGNTLFTTDVEGASQSFGFEPQRNRLTNLTDKRGNASTFEYDANGNLRKIQQPENVEVEFTHDGAGNVTSMRDGNGHTSTMTYNAHNDLTSIQYPIGQETFGYDGVGNMLSSTDGNGNSVQYSYDALNRVVGISDDFGERHAVWLRPRLQPDPGDGRQRPGPGSFGYDAHHRLQAVSTPAGTTQYGYDASDNLTAITDANQHTRTFDYDRRDLLTTERDPLGHGTAYTYDGNGNVLTRTDPNGKVTTYTYDRLNRLTAKTYDGNTDSYAYDANGNLVQCANSHISMSFVYDGLNRLTSKTVHNWGLTISLRVRPGGQPHQDDRPRRGDDLHLRHQQPPDQHHQSRRGNDRLCV